MHPWDANIETYSHRSSFMGPLQNFWWLQTSKIMESQNSKQKYILQSLVLLVAWPRVLLTLDIFVAGWSFGWCSPQKDCCTLVVIEGSTTCEVAPKMISSQVVKTTATPNNSPSKDHTHPNDQPTISTQPFSIFLCSLKLSVSWCWHIHKITTIAFILLQVLGMITQLYKMLPC